MWSKEVSLDGPPDYGVKEPRLGLLAKIVGNVLGSFIPDLSDARRLRKLKVDAYLKRRVRRGLGDRPSQLVPLSLYYDSSRERLDAAVRYYEFARKEIDREDQITFSRLNITLALQAFLIGATAFVFSAIVTAAPPNLSKLSDLFEQSRIRFGLVIAGLCIETILAFAGYRIAKSSLRGILASRKSLAFAKDQWISFNALNGPIYPHLVPQLTKYATLRDDKRHLTDQGTNFAIAVPSSLVLLWTCLLILWTILLLFVVGFFIVRLAATADGFLNVDQQWQLIRNIPDAISHMTGR